MAKETVMKERLTAREAAGLIERFLNGQERYPQEWNDFIEGRKVEPRVESFRKKCYELDPLVNTPVAPDEKALAELREIAKSLRQM